MPEDKPGYTIGRIADLGEGFSPPGKLVINARPTSEKALDALYILEAFLTRECKEPDTARSHPPYPFVPCKQRERGCLIDRKCPYKEYED